MCFGNNTTCLQCRRSHIRYRERCFLRLENPRGHIRNHRVNGLRRFISQCPRCQQEEECQQDIVARNTHYDHRRAKAVLEHIQGVRVFPQMNENLTEEQYRELYIRGQRLHPFRNHSEDIYLMTEMLETQAARSSHPGAGQIPARWRECVARQTQLDLADHFPSATDQQLSLQSIRAAVEESIPPPTPPPTMLRENSASLWNLYLLRRRLHPYPQGSRFIESITSALNYREASHPEDASFLSNWEECQRRQAEIETTGRILTAEDLEFSLCCIPGFAIPPPSPLYSNDSFEDELENFTERNNSDPSITKTPATFREWTLHSEKLTDRESPRSANFALVNDIANYSFYLERFEESYLHQFRRFVDELRGHEQQHWNFWPLVAPLGAIPAASFRDWFSQHEACPRVTEQSVLVSRENWLLIMTDYLEYLREFANEEDAIQFVNEREHVSTQIRLMLEGATEHPSDVDAFEEEEPGQGIPQTFAVWTSQFSSHHSPPADEQFPRDIEAYEHTYLGQGDFHARHLLEFRDTIARLRQNEVENFAYTPLTRPGGSRLSFDDFVINNGTFEQDPHFSEATSIWDNHLVVLRCYETHLSTPEHVSHFRRARNVWAEADRRELQGLSRDPLADILEAMQNDLTQIEAAIAHAREMIERNSRYMTHEQREQLRDSIAELENVEGFVRGHIELRGVPTEFQREEIAMTLHDARCFWSECVHAVNAGIQVEEEHPLTPSPTQISFHRERERTPASEVSEDDIGDCLILMLDDKDGDDASTVMGNDRDEEMSEADYNWSPTSPISESAG